ncbi:UAP56-interacting factor [Elysia marginata]|uniref:UAP56-interacting factor n=1 Tax=Elysia marginata TaxID=1093978 RepID=A0AAV4IML1_9GAST|nr:UAP56-interacting factor [Elysia marginata]
MSTAALNKVDMSLDEIIKINKLEKKQKAKLQTARGAKSTVRGRGGAGRGTVRGRGRGRGGLATSGAVVRGGAARRRGGVVASVRGRGAKQLHQNTTTRGITRQRGRGAGRGRGNSFRGQVRGQGARGSAAVGAGGVQSNRGGIQLFTRGGLNKQTAAQQQNQRLNKARKQAALLREKQLAMKNLQQAQKNMQTVTLALQKTNRDAVFNQRRGLSNSDLPTATTSGRGRRKLLANLGRQRVQTSNLNNNNNSSSRQLNYTSVTFSNPAALNNTQSQRGRRRPWNKPRVAPAAQPFKIEVTNESPVPPAPAPQQQQQQQSSVLEKLKSLKPSVPTTYKFQKNVFSAPTTGLSLSERFSGISSSSPANHLEDRKVFV